MELGLWFEWPKKISAIKAIDTNSDIAISVTSNGFVAAVFVVPVVVADCLWSRVGRGFSMSTIGFSGLTGAADTSAGCLGPARAGGQLG